MDRKVWATKSGTGSLINLLMGHPLMQELHTHPLESTLYKTLKVIIVFSITLGHALLSKSLGSTTP
jgi:hypothetical protein